MTDTETKRLRFRSLNEQDVSDLIKLYSDDLLVKHWGLSPISDEDKIIDIVKDADKQMKAGTKLTVGIEDKTTSKLIGIVLLFNFFESSQRCELGYMLNRSYWRKGYMTEAVNAVIHHGFECLGLRRIEADVNPLNIPSTQLLTKVGFQLEGVLKERWVVGDSVNDSAIYGLLNRNSKI
jgi:RimJ/RimL family protein N-acetyltransferase